MGDVAPLRGDAVLRPPVDPVPQLVDQLERLLAEARDGELRCFVGCGLSRDNSVISVYAGETGRQRFILLGGLYRVLHNMKRRLFPEEETPRVDG